MKNYSKLSDEELEAALQAAAADALCCQEACNASGVLFDWAENMRLLCEVSRRQGHGTDWRNGHAVNVLFASKLASLTRCEDQLVFSHTYDECKRLVKE